MAPIHDIIPVLSETHPILVDAEGRPVYGKPRVGTFAARRPIAIKFGSWEPSDAEQELVLGAVSEESQIFLQAIAKREREHADKFARAGSDISQTDIGPYLLRQAAARKTDIYADYSLIGTRTRGIASRNSIRVRPDLNHRQLCSTLIHELAHIEHRNNGLCLTSDSALAASMTIDSAQESAARTVEAVWAYQCDCPSPDEVPGIYHPPGMVSAFEQDYKAMGYAAQQARFLAEAGDWAGFARAVQPSYLDEFDIIAFYQTRTFSLYKDATREHQLASFMTDPKLPNFSECLTIMGVPYVDPAFFADPRITTLSQRPDARRAYQEMRAVLDPLNESRGGTMLLNINTGESERLDSLIELLCRPSVPGEKMEIL